MAAHKRIHKNKSGSGVWVILRHILGIDKTIIPINETFN